MRVAPTKLPLYGLQTPKSQEVIDACHSTPGMKWSKTLRVWEGHLDAVRCVVDKLGVDSKGLPSPKNIECWIKADYSGLRTYQKTGVEFLLVEGFNGCLLADGMGLGKSAQAVRALKALKSPSVIVCPAHVRGVWTRELSKWWPEAIPFHCRGTRPLDHREGVYSPFIINYDVLLYWAQWLLESGVENVVFDEVHYLQSEKSKRSKAARELAAKLRWRVGLSGTPMTNRPKDLFNVVDTLSPGRFGRWWDYSKRYCNAHDEIIERVGREPLVVRKTDGKSHLDELERRLEYFMLLRTVEGVKLELPPRSRQVIPCSVQEKVDVVLERIEGHLDAGRKVIVFTHRKDVAEMYVNRLQVGGVDADYIHGGVPIEEREKRRELAPQVLCCTIDSCATGIDFTHASVGIFAEFTWEGWELLQCEKRIDRFGQKSPTIFEYVVDELDDYRAQIVIDKLDTFNQVGLGDGGLKAELLKDGGSDLDRMFEAISKMEIDENS